MLNVRLLSIEHRLHDIRDFVGLVYICVPTAETSAQCTVGAW